MYARQAAVAETDAGGRCWNAWGVDRGSFAHSEEMAQYLNSGMNHSESKHPYSYLLQADKPSQTRNSRARFRSLR